MVKFLLLAVLFYFLFRLIWGIRKVMKTIRVETIRVQPSTSNSSPFESTSREKDISSQVKILSEKPLDSDQENK
jgi:hypothetical protein